MRSGQCVAGALQVDQDIEILNQIAANSPKVETLLAIISNILNEMPDGRSIASGANLDQQQAHRVIHTHQSIANGSTEYSSRHLGSASTPSALLRSAPGMLSRSEPPFL